MINLLLGAPGAGKSYEAVVFHILPALQKGRKVVTNLPLSLDQFAALDPSFPSLIEIRTQTKAERPVLDWEKAQRNWERFGIAAKTTYWNNSAFSHVEDYGDPWRHAEQGFGPLYVIDECHIALPRKSTPVAVEEWFSLHRHETADVLLITQSYGKVNQAVIDLVQACYRVRKNIAFGSQNSYVRKVQDGVRGEVVNTTIRRYQSKYFQLYKSHTKGGGSELGAQDIVPIWKHWSVLGAAAFLSLFFVLVLSGRWHLPLGSSKPAPVVPVSSSAPLASQRVAASAPSVPVSQSLPASASRPLPQDFGAFSERELHVVARLKSSRRDMFVFVVSQNGQPVMQISSDDLIAAGYSLSPSADCVVKVSYGKVSRFAICDLPQVGTGLGQSVSEGGKGGSPLAGGSFSASQRSDDAGFIPSPTPVSASFMGRASK